MKHPKLGVEMHCVSKCYACRFVKCTCPRVNLDPYVVRVGNKVWVWTKNPHKYLSLGKEKEHETQSRLYIH